MTLDELTVVVADLKRKIDQFVNLGSYRFLVDTYFDGKIKSGIYSGTVAGSGAATHLPAGWTSAKTSSGHYTVTHNLGNTNYNVVVGALTVDSANSPSQTATTFTVICVGAGSITDAPFSFILMRI